MKHALTRLAAVAALAGGMAFAQTSSTAPEPQPGRHAMGRQAGAHQRMMQQLNLTDAQKAQAKEIFGQARQQAQPLMQQLKGNREALAAAVKSDDTAKIQQLAGTQGNLRGQMLAIRSTAFAKFYGILTPDQKAKADQLHQQFEQRMEQRLGSHRRNG
ncbi:MAG TPA: Spy/CpxP family protein refolding chaperone [Bryobacteraceae bacterium]